MIIQAFKAPFADQLSQSVLDKKLHADLVRALYSTPYSILGATIVATMIVAIAASLSRDPYYGAFFSGFVIVGIWRAVIAALYRRAQHDANDGVATIAWERRALVGAWAFAGLVGLMGMYTTTAHPGENVELLISCCVIGYIAGISSRNASRPFVTIGQISLTCIPFAFALILQADIVHVGLAIFIGSLYASTIIMCRVAFDNIIARYHAYSTVENLAQRDSLTELWNRTAILSFLETHLAALDDSDEIIALIAIDLDRFKDINDTFGHPAGDTILKEAADRIGAAVRSHDKVARIGGDEFFVAMTGLHSIAEVEAVSRRIVEQFVDPFAINMTSTACGASVGYAIAPMDGCTLGILLRNADLALYEAKKKGRGQVIAYAPKLSELYEVRVALEHDLQFASSKGQLEVVYQPIVDPRSGRAICCEALLRWNHPEHGSISPATFIPIAETTGLIGPIGTWVLNTACAEAINWGTDVKVSVNLSPVQFRRGRELVEIVLAALATSGLSADRLALEVTETILIDDTPATLAIIEELRGHGIGVALDDFGTGFSSLAYLNDFPFSTVKLDKKFSQQIDHSKRTAAIVGAIAEFARELKIELVAEGIETESQLRHIQKFGINAIQGYLYSKPLPAMQIRRIISQPILRIPPHGKRFTNALKAYEPKRVADSSK